MEAREGALTRAVRFIDVLKKRDFLLLWMGQLISQFGDRLNQMALIALIMGKESVAGRATEVSMLFFFMVLPAVVLGPIAGVFVDRWDRKKTMIASDLIRAILVAIIPFAGCLKYIWPIYTIVFIIFALTRFFIPAKLAIIPALVNKNELFIANSISIITTMLATILGMALGGLVIAWIGVNPTLFMDAATYLVSALFLLAVPMKRIEPEGKRFKSFLNDLLKGFRYLANHCTVHGSIIVLFCLMAGAGIISVTFILFLQRQIGVDQKGVGDFIRALGLVGSFSGLGMLFGIGLTGRYEARIKESFLFPLSLILLGGTVFLITLTKSYLLMVVIAFFGGILAPSTLVFINTSIHKITPESFHGRIFSALDIVNNLALLFSILLAGFLATFMEGKTILQILGIVLTTFGLMLYLGGVLLIRRQE